MVRVLLSTKSVVVCHGTVVDGYAVQLSANSMIAKACYYLT